MLWADATRGASSDNSPRRSRGDPACVNQCLIHVQSHHSICIVKFRCLRELTETHERSLLHAVRQRRKAFIAWSRLQPLVAHRCHKHEELQNAAQHAGISEAKAKVLAEEMIGVMEKGGGA